MNRIWELLGAHFLRVPEEERFRALLRLRERFLVHDIPPGYLDDAATLAAYESWFFPQSYVKAASVCEELSGAAVHRIIDLGAGMGPLGFAALARWPNAELVLVDRSALALRAGGELAQAMGARVQTRLHSLDNGLPALDGADLVLCGNVLFELSAERARVLASAILDALPAHGHLVIIEPADRLHARAVQALRDALLPRAPMSPCPHVKPCPASERARDFCHQARSLPLPPFWLALAARLNLSDTRMRFSYLAYGPPKEAAPNLVRIISHRRVEKGRTRYFGCSAVGRVEIMRQDRLRSAKNAAFDTLGRGALLRLENPGSVVKIGADDVVSVVGPPDPWDAEG